VSLSVVAVGVVAMGSVAVGLGLAMGGLAVGPVALGGAVLGYYANGAMAWGIHVMGPNVPYDPESARIFNPRTQHWTDWVFRICIAATPVFLALGFIPSLMAKRSERRARKAHAGVFSKRDPS